MAAAARIGCAGWSLTAQAQSHVPAPGTHLERYASIFNCAEITSSFYRPHQPRTYARWAASVPADFRFAVKAPRTITHDAKLAACGEEIERFLGEIRELGDKLGPVLVQLPPSLAFDAELAKRFFAALRDCFDDDVVCEPRHASWFTGPVSKLLASYRVARVAADPARLPEALRYGGWNGLVYARLHGAPELYRSKYAPAFLDDMAARVVAAVRQGISAWTIFDNTTLGHAFFDALALRDRVRAAG